MTILYYQYTDYSATQDWIRLSSSTFKTKTETWATLQF